MTTPQELASIRAEVEAAVKSPFYTERDAIAQGADYFRHVNAMTAEKLHSKSAIAAELAHRDILIQRLMAALESARADALDEAAELCMEDDLLMYEGEDNVAEMCARYIRKLKEPKA